MEIAQVCALKHLTHQVLRECSHRVLFDYKDLSNLTKEEMSKMYGNNCAFLHEAYRNSASQGIVISINAKDGACLIKTKNGHSRRVDYSMTIIILKKGMDIPEALLLKACYNPLTGDAVVEFVERGGRIAAEHSDLNGFDAVRVNVLDL